jgi:hypothetical protein
VGWSNIEGHFALLWKRKGIYKEKRQLWIEKKAYAVVNDHSRMLRLKFSKDEFNDLLMTVNVL